MNITSFSQPISTTTTTSDLTSPTSGSWTEKTPGFSILILLILLPLYVVTRKGKKKSKLELYYNVEQFVSFYSILCKST
jgi:hypothetical protein